MNGGGGGGEFRREATEFVEGRTVVEVFENTEAGKFDMRVARLYDGARGPSRTSMLRTDHGALHATFCAMARAWAFVEARRMATKHGVSPSKAVESGLLDVPPWLKPFIDGRTD